MEKLPGETITLDVLVEVSGGVVTGVAVTPLPGVTARLRLVDYDEDDHPDEAEIDLARAGMTNLL